MWGLTQRSSGSVGVNSEVIRECGVNSKVIRECVG